MAKGNGHGAGKKNGGKPKSRWHKAEVKSFNPSRGYGFLQTPRVRSDIYVHENVAKVCGVPLPLVPGQEVMVRWRDGPQGRPQAASLKLPA